MRGLSVRAGPRKLPFSNQTKEFAQKTSPTSCADIQCPLSVPAGPGLRDCPSLRETPQHSKRSHRDDFLKRRIVGRHFFRLHDGGSYFGRRERP
jgi:hypothetical protein